MMDGRNKRRQPYSILPADIADNGFVEDLLHEATNLADGFGLRIHKFKKNNDWFFAIRVPSHEDLAVIDRATSSIIEPAITSDQSAILFG